MKFIRNNIVTVTAFLLQWVLPVSVDAQAPSSYRHTMKAVPETSKFTIADNKNDEYCPFSEEGWYYSQAGVEATPDGLVAVYRRSDFHTANSTDIMVAYSSDKGKTWEGHHSIAHADVWNEKGCWVAPQLSKLKDGRLVIIADFGQRTSGQNWPMLAQWQQPDRGMANYLFWSYDHGKTWEGPVKADEVGGEPGYITELSDGSLLYTRTQSKETDQLWNPPMPWGNIYYYNEAVISTDGGKTWPIVATLGDDPHQGDCEVGTTEMSAGKLLAITRIGMGNGAFGQPSRFAYSYDGGRSWTDHQLSPVYGQRPIVHTLQSGKLLVTYRNKWGTPGTYALLFDPEEELPYEPASFIFEENRCTLSDGVMTLNTEEGIQKLVTFTFYPAQAPDSRVEIEAEIRVDEADINGCNLSAGCYVSIRPDKVSLGDRPEESFSLDATQWHRYRIVRENKTISIYVDDELKLQTATEGLETRMVQVGNRQVKGANFYQIGNEQDTGWGTKALSHWRALSVKVENQNDYDIDWTWDPAKGYPDQFRRDRIVLLDRISASAGHCGYSGWTQMEDGTIVIADYTVGGNGGPPAAMPFIRAYVTTEEALNGNIDQ